MSPCPHVLDFRKESIKATTNSKGPCFSALQTTDLGDDGKTGHSCEPEIDEGEVEMLHALAP